LVEGNQNAPKLISRLPPEAGRFMVGPATERMRQTVKRPESSGNRINKQKEPRSMPKPMDHRHVPS